MNEKAKLYITRMYNDVLADVQDIKYANSYIEYGRGIALVKEGDRLQYDIALREVKYDDNYTLIYVEFDSDDENFIHTFEKDEFFKVFSSTIDIDKWNKIKRKAGRTDHLSLCGLDDKKVITDLNKFIEIFIGIVGKQIRIIKCSNIKEVLQQFQIKQLFSVHNQLLLDAISEREWVGPFIRNAEEEK